MIKKISTAIDPIFSLFTIMYRSHCKGGEKKKKEEEENSKSCSRIINYTGNFVIIIIIIIIINNIYIAHIQQWHHLGTDAL